MYPSVPTLAEWAELWQLWDTITLGMIPKQMLHTQPIHLRHICLFYLGHIPTFLDIHLTQVLKENHTEPEYFKDIFERGIDPLVDDPSTIHPHSEVPTAESEWPALEEVLAFRDKVRARLIKVYEDHRRGGEPTIREFGRKLGRVLWMTWEHEAFHLETLLYMLIQKSGEGEDGTQPPPGIPVPQWDAIARLSPLPDQSTVILKAGTKVSIGHDDYESEDSATPLAVDHEFGWDNESPKREMTIERDVKIEQRPILIGEFYDFWTSAASKDKDLPAMWIKDDNQILIRTLFGPVPLRQAINWPFIGSYDELAAYAASKGGRIPDEVELIHYMDTYQSLEGANIEFKYWHFIPPTETHTGGAREWTSSKFDAYPGFEKSVLYPGFSSDFFDGVHHTVLGAAFATVRRQAHRRTLRNWFQHNYKFAWIGGRVAYDI